MTAIYVCALSEMPAHVERLGASHLVSLMDPGTLPPTPSCLAPDRHLRIGVHDIPDALPGLTAPGVEHMEALLGFAERWDGGAPLLVHCFMGISRSTAAALALLCRSAPGQEDEAVALLRRIAPHAQPNRALVRAADLVLGCGGRLEAAVATIGAAVPIGNGPLVRLPMRL